MEEALPVVRYLLNNIPGTSKLTCIIITVTITEYTCCVIITIIITIFSTDRIIVTVIVASFC